jgi:hypothetical protein
MKRPSLMGSGGGVGGTAGLGAAGGCAGAGAEGGFAFIFIKLSGNGGLCTRKCGSSGGIIRFAANRSAAMHKAENNRDKQKRGDSSHEKTANNGTAQWRILLTTFTKAEAHRQHADQHCGCRH